ncbi:MAG: enolase C-terminal domain-like protein [Spirochaetota bacterium]
MPSSPAIGSIRVEDIRFRFSRLGSGSDANNPHTDYSNPYVTVSAGDTLGAGIGFTLGRGNDLVCRAVSELAPLVEGLTVDEFVGAFGRIWRVLANPAQSRWIAPGAGPYHMAAGAIANAVFDAWAKRQGLPLWEALVRLEPEQIVEMLDFRYVEHLLTRDEALTILSRNAPTRGGRVQELKDRGLPCYHTTWIGSSTAELLDQIEGVRRERGITTFKVKVGSDLRYDRERLAAIRERFGEEIGLLVDANQVWSVPQAIEWMEALADYRVGWIEEPTAPDLVDGHRLIREALASLSIEVVTGENCPNAQLAAQLIAGGAVDRFQIDACRVIGPAENILIMLIAAKHSVPVCPHAGGSGLDELVPHLSAFNYACCSPTLERVLVEQVGFCADFFVAPSTVRDGRVAAPSVPGYIVGMTDEARRTCAYPSGSAWSSSSSIGMAE